MGAKLVTGRNSDYSVHTKIKTINNKIEDNTTVTGDVLCIMCEMSNFKEESKKITFSTPTGPKKTMKLKTYRCGVCAYEVINDKEMELMRNKLK